MKRLLILFLLLVLVAPAFGAVKKVKPKPKVKPKVSVTKKIAKKIALPASPEAVVEKVIGFKDLKPSHFAYPYVMKMVVSYEALSGYPDGTFQGNRTITRAEFSKVLTNTLSYLEKKYDILLAEEPATPEVAFKDLEPGHWSYSYVAKLVTKYKIISGYPDGTYKPNKTINRFELATVLAKTLKIVYEKYKIKPPEVREVTIKDVKPTHWAMKDIQLLLFLGIMDLEKDKTFKGTKPVTRFDIAVSGAKLIDLVLREKPLPLPVVKVAPPPSQVEKALEISSKPQATLSGGFGNIYESASGTNNWMSFNGAATYSDKFSLWRLSGNYEITGKYIYNQINYIVPRSGGGTSGGVVNENRHELEINTIYPVVEVFGISGKLLLGAKYINLSNPTAPSNFTGLNAGLVSGAKIFGRNFLLRGFYSLPLMRAVVSPSVLGQPSQLFDYEASLDADIFSYPVLFGFSGELMTLSGGSVRYYNTFFVRYFLL